jgi:hypothetical protein
MLKKWYTQKEAAEYFSISERTCLTMRQKGMLIEGVCWRKKIPQNPNSHVIYHLENCEEVLNRLATARSKETAPFENKKEVATA